VGHLSVIQGRFYKIKKKIKVLVFGLLALKENDIFFYVINQGLGKAFI